MSSARASELLSDVSPAMNRFRALLPESPFPGAVALEVLFEGFCRVQSSPDSRTALSLCSSITQFAKDACMPLSITFGRGAEWQVSWELSRLARSPEFLP